MGGSPLAVGREWEEGGGGGGGKRHHSTDQPPNSDGGYFGLVALGAITPVKVLVQRKTRTQLNCRIQNCPSSSQLPVSSAIMDQPRRRAPRRRINNAGSTKDSTAAVHWRPSRASIDIGEGRAGPRRALAVCKVWHPERPRYHSPNRRAACCHSKEHQTGGKRSLWVLVATSKQH